MHALTRGEHTLARRRKSGTGKNEKTHYFEGKELTMKTAALQTGKRSCRFGKGCRDLDGEGEGKTARLKTPASKRPGMRSR